MTINLANLAGFLAILLWSTTTLFLSFMSDVPPFLNTTLIYFCSFLILSLRWIWQRQNPLRFFYKNPFIILWNVFGLAVNFACIVVSMRMIPVIETNLINYLWPLMCVMLASFLPGKHFQIEYILGALIGFAGIYIIVSRGSFVSFEIEAGHYIMFFGALSWAIFSVGTRLFKDHPSDFITIGFFYGGFIFYFLHLIFESDADYVLETSDIRFILLLSAASGSAYMLWDHAMKHGHMQLLNVSSNFLPLLSTLYLIAFGKAVFSMSVIFSAFLIVLGTLVASKDRVVRLYRSFYPKA